MTRVELGPLRLLDPMGLQSRAAPENPLEAMVATVVAAATVVEVATVVAEEDTVVVAAATTVTTTCGNRGINYLAIERHPS